MKTPYTYSVLRYVHDTTTGEFINVGVALLAPNERYVSAICRPTYGRLTKTFPGMDGEAFKGLMRFIQSQFEEMGGHLCGDLPFDEAPKSIMELAHKVLPPDDSSLQWSPAGSGLTENPSQTLERLFERMVVAYDEKPQREVRSDDQVWHRYRRDLETRHVIRHLKPKRIAVEDDEVEFRYAWKNGIWHCLEPVSLDLALADSIRDKAHRWLGHISSVQNAAEPFKIYFLLGQPQRADLQSAYKSAISILGKIPSEKEIVTEDNAERFSDQFAREIEAAEHSNT
ncbi:MAG: hypothetical protein AMXMBFR82_22030 [Candidatus Hydrogenedentota bacterium]